VLAGYAAVTEVVGLRAAPRDSSPVTPGDAGDLIEHVERLLLARSA
jgi:hypothetical protein